MRRNTSLAASSAALLVVSIVILVLAPAGWAQSKYKTLHKFELGRGGFSPFAGLIFDQAGNLYGTTLNGGGRSLGTVFMLKPKADGSWTESVLYSFCSSSSCVDGSSPWAGLIFDQAGNLYGTTSEGGASRGGTVFMLKPNPGGSWTESVLYSFCSLAHCSDGSFPVDGVIFDTAGNLYGTTSFGGNSNFNCNGNPSCGVVFELTPNRSGSWTESILHNFCSSSNCGDGAIPYAGVIFDRAGSLYGTATGLTGGVVFKLTRNPDGSWKEKVLHQFNNGKDGGFPTGGLVSDGSGNLYGTTEDGGVYGEGVAFMLTSNPDGIWKEKVLHQFADGKDGASPYAGLAFDQAGSLYGTTVYGGSNGNCGGLGCGVVFKLRPKSNGGWHESVLHSFLDHQGANPYAGVIFDAAGDLYGTSRGDTAGHTRGSVFEIMP
jgi:uncharacterized repeat protein (TIGR03803 family)